MWFDTDRSTVLHLETIVNSPPLGARNGTPLQLPGWQTSMLNDSAAPVVNVSLGTDHASVLVQGVGLSADEVVELADSLRARPAGQPGWEVDGLPAGVVAFGEGWDSTGASHHVEWTRADGTLVGELTVALGGAHLAMTNQHWTEARQFTKIDETFAVVTDTGGVVAFTWEPAPGVTALFGWYGPIVEATAIAQSLREVGRADWEALVPLGTSTDDGCRSLFC